MLQLIKSKLKQDVTMSGLVLFNLYVCENIAVYIWNWNERF
jgi:hypothetical protein